MTDTTTTELHAELGALGERYFALQHTTDPYNATLLGLHEFDHLSPDPSSAATAEASAAFAALAGDVVDLQARLEAEDATADDRVDVAVLRSLVTGARTDTEDALWAANASAKGYVSRQGTLFQAVPAMSVTDAGSGERFLARLAGIPCTFEALGARYAEEARRGRVPTRRGVLQSIQQLEGHLDGLASDDTLLTAVRDDSVAGIRDRATAVLERDVRPALAALAERMRRDLLTVARDDDAVGIRAIPGGDEAYLRAVARQTTTDLDPEEIHRIGLQELDELRAQWAAIGAEAFGERDPETVRRRLRDDVTLRFDSTQEILALAGAAVRRAEDALPRYLGGPAIESCEIRAIDADEAEHAALGYYQPPADDGSRRGIYFLGASDPASRFRYEYECLSFHEAVPGHHLQLASAQGLEIPRYRRHLDTELCAFNEGWGLYSERLADELGLYSDPLQRLGMLSFSALRACRLVVDTGMHHFGWSRQRAIEVMEQNTATTGANIRSEVDRYIAWPGQALAYVMGRREIVRQRVRAINALGERFDLPAFHGAVLGQGPLPLTVLDDVIGTWLEGAR